MKKIFAVFILIIIMFALFKIGVFEYDSPVKINTTLRVTENNIEWMVQLYENGDVAIQPIGALPANIIIPEKIEGHTVTHIAEYAFSGYTNIKTVEIPDSVRAIGDYAFWGCESLVSVSLSNQITKLSENIFLGCSTKLLDNIKKHYPQIEWK